MDSNIEFILSYLKNRKYQVPFQYLAIHVLHKDIKFSTKLVSVIQRVKSFYFGTEDFFTKKITVDVEAFHAIVEGGVDGPELNAVKMICMGRLLGIASVKNTMFILRHLEDVEYLKVANMKFLKDAAAGVPPPTFQHIYMGNLHTLHVRQISV